MSSALLSIFLNFFLFSPAVKAPHHAIISPASADDTPNTVKTCIDEVEPNLGINNKDDYCREKLDLGVGVCQEELIAYYKNFSTLTVDGSLSENDRNRRNKLDDCKEEKNTLKVYPKCTDEIGDLYRARKAAEGIEQDTKEEGEKKKLTAAVEAERAFKGCKNDNDYETGDKKCEEAGKEFKDSVKEFNDHCGAFGGGKKCIKTIRSCDECSFTEGSGDLDCVLIKNQAICPELADGVLEDMKEEREDYTEKIEDLQDKLDDLKDGKERLEAELSEEKAAYAEDIEALKAEEAGLKEEEEGRLKGIKAQTKAAVQKAMAQIRADMGKVRQLEFELANAIEAAHRKYRDLRNKVYRDCKTESNQKINAYRKRRKAAIRHGQFRKESIYEMLQQNRVSFAQKDDARYARYYSRCIAQNKYLVQSYKEDLMGELKKIEQQKQLIVSQFQTMQGQLMALSKQADEENQGAVQDYMAAMQKIVNESMKQTHSRYQKYRAKAGSLNRKVSSRNMEIMQTMGVLQETQNRFNHNKEMYNRLRAAGAPSEDKSSELADASEGYTNLKSEWESAFESCDCSTGRFERGRDPVECRKIKEMGRMVDFNNDKLRNYTGKESDKQVNPTRASE